MKNSSYILLLLIIVSCNAQSPVINLRDWKGENIVNSYLKDANNELDAYEGTYVFTSGDTIFKIKLKKVIKAKTIRYYRDLLVGEMEYKIGNITLLNTLPQLNTVYFDQANHKIDGGSIFQNLELPVCPECAPNEITLRLSIDDTQYFAAFFVKKTIINGMPALRVFKRTSGPITKTAGQPKTVSIIRDGDYIFIKQP